jgi:hypothetical protein
MYTEANEEVISVSVVEAVRFKHIHVKSVTICKMWFLWVLFVS